MISTSGFLTASECIKFVFGRGSTPDPNEGSLQCSHRTPSWFKGPYEGRQRGKKKGRGEERNGRDRPPFRKFLDPPLQPL